MMEKGAQHRVAGDTLRPQGLLKDAAVGFGLGLIAAITVGLVSTYASADPGSETQTEIKISPK
jgi:hypothetical protein